MDFVAFNSQIKPLDTAAMDKAFARWDSIAKPLGSLGGLETTVTKLAGMTGADPHIDKRAVVVLSADNGVTKSGVAATPAEVTLIMTEFIVQARSAVGVMATHMNAEVITVDMGMFAPIDQPGLIDRRIANGTNNMAEGPAMSKEQALQGIQTGIEIMDDLKKQGYKIVATGEMGIGNTSTTAALASVLLDRPVSEMVGRGVGLDDEGFARKTRVVEQALEVNKPDPNDPLDALAKVGGFDIAAMCGLFLGGAKNQIPVIVDGVISSISAVLAARLCPASIDYMVASHLSAEPCAGALLAELKLDPPLHAGMRLGEGTGAVAVLPLIDLALDVYYNTITYADIGF